MHLWEPSQRFRYRYCLLGLWGGSNKWRSSGLICCWIWHWTRRKCSISPLKPRRSRTFLRNVRYLRPSASEVEFGAEREGWPVGSKTHWLRVRVSVEQRTWCARRWNRGNFSGQRCSPILCRTRMSHVPIESQSDSRGTRVWTRMWQGFRRLAHPLAITSKFKLVSNSCPNL